MKSHLKLLVLALLLSSFVLNSPKALAWGINPSLELADADSLVDIYGEEYPQPATAPIAVPVTPSPINPTVILADPNSSVDIFGEEYPQPPALPEPVVVPPVTTPIRPVSVNACERLIDALNEAINHGDKDLADDLLQISVDYGCH